MEQQPADLIREVGDDASSREDRMVEIRVALPASVEAHGLVQRLAALFERSSVSFDETQNEVRVRSEWESRSVAAVIGAVQSWLVVDGVTSAELSVGDRSYTMVGPRVALERFQEQLANADANGKAPIPAVGGDRAR